MIVFWFFCVSERGTPAEQLSPHIVDTMFPSDSNYALYGWKKDVFAVIKKKEKEECIYVWRIVVAAEKIKGKFMLCFTAIIICYIFHCAV